VCGVDMSKARRLKKLNMAVAAALMLAASGERVLADQVPALRGTVADNCVQNQDTCLFPLGSSGV